MGGYGGQLYNIGASGIGQQRITARFMHSVWVYALSTLTKTLGCTTDLWSSSEAVADMRLILITLNYVSDVSEVVLVHKNSLPTLF